MANVSFSKKDSKDILYVHLPMHACYVHCSHVLVTLLIRLFTSHVNLQLLAQAVGMFACIVLTRALQRQKEQFKSVLLEHGIRSAITFGNVLMQMWSADSLVLAKPVSATYCIHTC